MEHKTQKEEMFNTVYKSYATDIYRVCLHLTEDEEKAQEIMQQVFVNFYNRSENVDLDYAFAYLVCTAKKLACNHQRDLMQKKCRKLYERQNDKRVQRGIGEECKMHYGRG